MAKAFKTHAAKALNRAIGKAIHKYDMLAAGDRIAVGISGGQDSLTLMRMLQIRRGWSPVPYELFGIYIDPGFEGGFGDELKAYCDAAGYFLHVEKSDFGLQGHGPENRENPCFLCARLRRKRLFEIAAQLGCSKLALGHNKDDIIETLFLNIFYAGEISTMLPCQPLFANRFSVIRPLAFADEGLIRKFAREQQLPELVNPCPSAGRSKRQEVKQMLHNLYRSNAKIKGNIFRALSHVKNGYLLKP